MSRRISILITTLSLVLTLTSLLVIPRIKFGNELITIAWNKPSTGESQTQITILVSIKIPRTLGTTHIQEYLNTLKDIDPEALILSPQEFMDLQLSGEGLQEVQAWDPVRNALSERAEKSRFLRTIFYGNLPVENPQHYYIRAILKLTPESSNKLIQELPFLGREVTTTSLVHNFSLIETSIKADFFRSLQIALPLLVISGFIITRRKRILVALGIAALIPALWTTASLYFLGLELNVVTSIAPFFSMAITGPFLIHRLRGWTAWQGEGKSLKNSLEFRGILLSSLTTATAMVLLIISSDSLISTLGLLLLLSTIYGALSGICILPALLTLLPPPKKPGNLVHWLEGPETFTTGTSRGRGSLLAAIILLVVSGSLGGILMLSDPPLTLINNTGFPPDSSIGRYIRETELSGISLGEIEVTIDTGVPGGILTPSFLGAMEQIAQDIQDDEQVAIVNTLLPMLSWFSGRLAGTDDALPTTMEEAGENLELVASDQAGMLLRRYTDPDYSRFSMFITPSLAGSDNRSLNTLKRDLTQKISNSRAEGTLTISGPYVDSQVIQGEITRQFTQGAPILVLVLVIFLMFATKHPQGGALPAVSVILAVFSFMIITIGFGGGLSLVDCAFLSLLIGVSNDDAIFMYLSLRQHRSTRRVVPPIIQTTLIFTIILTPLAFSDFTPLVISTLAGISSLWVATLSSLFLLPRIFPLWNPR